VNLTISGLQAKGCSLPGLDVGPGQHSTIGRSFWGNFPLRPDSPSDQPPLSWTLSEGSFSPGLTGRDGDISTKRYFQKGDSSLLGSEGRLCLYCHGIFFS